ncbi:MAG: plasmid pRiA4b ORF-3 family protein [Paucibacter sp.]|nr:plasmid pRiA4b ORF-3 family protein [Roseateles sp.]
MNIRKTPARSKEPALIYELLVRLEGIEPRIWRRLWVPGTVTLAKLDRVIQTTMGWTNSHLHEFSIAGKRYGMLMDEDWPDEDNPVLEDKRYKLGQVLGEVVRDFRYTYDFGDNWRHTVMVERTMAADEINTWPQCLAGHNACPPEDVGGIGGYADFLEAVGDPAHEEYFAMRCWCGGPFDPFGFDINATNAALRKLR